jgi:hypothetical protein
MSSTESKLQFIYKRYREGNMTVCDIYGMINLLTPKQIDFFFSLLMDSIDTDDEKDEDKGNESE